MAARTVIKRNLKGLRKLSSRSLTWRMSMTGACVSVITVSRLFPQSKHKQVHIFPGFLTLLAKDVPLVRCIFLHVKVCIHHHFICLYVYNKEKKTYSKLLGEETSGNHQAYRRGHLDITILNKIRAAKECGRN